MRKIFRIIHGEDCAFSEGKDKSCTIHGEDCAFSEGKGEFCTIHGRNFAFKGKKSGSCTKHRVLTVETLKNRCSNICILRAYGENTCQGPLFGGNKKRNRKTSEAETKRENLWYNSLGKYQIQSSKKSRFLH